MFDEHISPAKIYIQCRVVCATNGLDNQFIVIFCNFLDCFLGDIADFRDIIYVGEAHEIMLANELCLLILMRGYKYKIHTG